MKQALFKALILSTLALSTQVKALEFGKPIKASVVVNSQSQTQRMLRSGRGNEAALLPLKKTVMLMNIKLTNHQKQTLLKAPLLSASSATPSQNSNNLPQQYDRGMNGTPVLNQGMHGSCVTFAISAAMDALLGKGDYVSPLCSLALGSYFEQKGYIPSGWDGSIGPIVLNQFISFGIINKSNQENKSCGGLSAYPLMNPNEVGSPMSLDDFKNSSENLNDRIYWEPLLSLEQRIDWDSESSNPAKTLLTQIKKTLLLHNQNERQDSRVTFAVLVPVDYCSAGACGRYHAENDSWVLTDAIKNDLNPNLAGHEMVITGYDDNAVAIDGEGNKHRGLLILRNSWGTDAGDNGTYYMSYEYFSLFVAGVEKIVIEN